MLIKIKKYVLKTMYDYHYHAENYYLGKISNNKPEYNGRWWEKVLAHADKEYELVRKLIQLEETYN